MSQRVWVASYYRWEGKESAGIYRECSMAGSSEKQERKDLGAKGAFCMCKILYIRE